MNGGKVTLSKVEMLVLDEADHMFDKGFLPDIRRILRRVPQKRQTLVFSATMPNEIRSFAKEILSDPATVEAKHTKPAATIEHAFYQGHAFYQVDPKNKVSLLKKILKEKDITTVIVFTRTKYKAKNQASKLHKIGCNATSLQGNLSQQKRQRALNGFKSGTYNILVATDIAARGIDVSNISHVINYDMPATTETYTHRTGRTGRAGCTGEAFTFVTPGDQKMIKAIKRTLDLNLIYEKDPQTEDGCRLTIDKKKKQISTQPCRSM
jgi:superfamily II DNA/RNA helicase